MDIKEAYESLSLKFKSGNNMPVERSTILCDEWDAIKNFLDANNANGFYACTVDGLDDAILNCTLDKDYHGIVDDCAYAHRYKSRENCPHWKLVNNV